MRFVPPTGPHPVMLPMRREVISGGVHVARRRDFQKR